MLTANRIHEFLNSAFEWDELLKRQIQRSSSTHNPRIAVGANSVLLEVDMPGVSRDSLDVEVLKNSLSVGFVSPEDGPESGAWKLRERSTDRDRLEFSFPFEIDAENSNLELSDGVLKIELKKPAEEAPRKLEVR